MPTSHQNLSQDRQGGGKFSEYNVTLSSGESFFILAANSEDAAWTALELSEDRQCKLINVMLTHEW